MKKPTSAFGLRPGPFPLKSHRYQEIIVRARGRRRRPLARFLYKLVFSRGNGCQGVCFTQRAVFTQDFFPNSYRSLDNGKKLKPDFFGHNFTTKKGRNVHLRTDLEATSISKNSQTEIIFKHIFQLVRKIFRTN